MKISKLVVVCAALAMGATLMADSNSNQVVVAPSQGEAGMRSIRIESPVLKGQLERQLQRRAEQPGLVGDGNERHEHLMRSGEMTTRRS